MIKIGNEGKKRKQSEEINWQPIRVRGKDESKRTTKNEMKRNERKLKRQRKPKMKGKKVKESIEI